mmetsp:Transcript_18609/g.40269  ORF Transcript_18609/g.40269 Transcript_18609/m.40269 type:complete len:130 (+) Transcript_18609:256-645(+)|eukprot:CAMPEP_0172328300 /NCGR_PEP_ID=MMETSP1058-20130122/60279_1 /TAXON_ID=83371 /ORGANISM="Detonula confervacea, Strain CCMP 353" /LENGTH=129 /DNA_ID=CAMNT_0013045409 /DNA_START=229 /DNA_END=618 /DNA_ORIENTATION=+
MADRKQEEKLSRRHGGYTNLAFWLRQDEYLPSAAFTSKVGDGIRDRRDLSSPPRPEDNIIPSKQQVSQTSFQRKSMNLVLRGRWLIAQFAICKWYWFICQMHSSDTPSKLSYGDELFGESPRAMLQDAL